MIILWVLPWYNLSPLSSFLPLTFNQPAIFRYELSLLEDLYDLAPKHRPLHQRLPQHTIRLGPASRQYPSPKHPEHPPLNLDFRTVIHARDIPS
jgi:hypothetical protein